MLLSAKQVNEATAYSLERVTTKDWRTELYLQGILGEVYGTDKGHYFSELENEWPKLYDIKNGHYYPEVLKHPSDIDFYLDFIDSTAAISEFSISNISRRSKVVVDDSINCVFEPQIPDFILIELDTDETEKLRQECEDKGQRYIQMHKNIFSKISGGGWANSAYVLVRDLLYQYTSYNSNISINAIPIFHLEPNTRITVQDPESGIYGDYMINNISIPLDITGTMTLSCIQALERI